MKKRKSHHAFCSPLHFGQDSCRLLTNHMPFVTEKSLDKSQSSIVTAAYPTVSPAFEDLAAHTGVESLKDLIRAVRVRVQK